MSGIYKFVDTSFILPGSQYYDMSFTIGQLNNNSDFSTHAKAVNNKFVAAINIPARNIAFKIPDLITKSPPNNVKITVVIHPKVLE